MTKVGFYKPQHYVKMRILILKPARPINKIARTFETEEEKTQCKINKQKCPETTYPFCCLLSPWFSLSPLRCPSATSWEISLTGVFEDALHVGCHGTLTAGLAALSTGERWSALDLALACSPEVVNGGGVTVASGGGEAREKLAWAGVKADDGDGMEVTLEDDTAPNGLGALLKAITTGDETLGATADAMGTGLTSSFGSTYVK